jgi:hypothetical protein
MNVSAPAPGRSRVLYSHGRTEGERNVEKLYLDNYRGFSNQYIEIRNVNFLVGENSTGKSSVLLAISTLFSNKFWFNLDFSVTEGQGYSFDDLVSAAAADRSYFSLGYIFDSLDKTSFVFKFINDGGKPVLSKAVIAIKGQAFYFNIPKTSNDITYAKIEKGEVSLDAFALIQKWQHFEHLERTIDGSPFMLVNTCIDEVTSELDGNIFPPLSRTIDFIAPIRSKPRKTYDEPATPITAEGGHIPYHVRHLFKKNDTKLRERLNEFGRQSGLFNDIEIKNYGTDFDDDAPFRLNFLLDKTPINIVNLGYGVSQVLPILVNIFTGRHEIFEIQQPEVHLHPKAQAALGDVFFDISTFWPHRIFFIETHSDYLIDRFRQCQKKSEKKVSAQVLFFERSNGLNKACSITIDQTGAYSKDQPPEFQEFFLTEAMENLGL